MSAVQQRGLAVLGGSFDPPHLAHRRIAEAALTQLPVDAVAVIPAGDHPHKRARRGTPAADRLAMCRLQFAGMPGVRVDDREVRRQGASFTVDTLTELKAEAHSRPLYFLIGSDNLPLLPTWKHHHRILELCTVATFPRPGHPIDPGSLRGLDLTPLERERLMAHVLVLEPDPASATSIRQRLRRGERNLPELLPAVEAYAVRNRLYET